MTRQTSIDAFAYLVQGEHLARSQRGVYAALYHFGPLTASELRDVVFDDDPANEVYGFVGKMEQCNITKRLSEMQKAGFVREVTTRECVVTRRVVIVWDVTDRIHPDIVEPERSGPRPTKDEFSAAVEEIEGFAHGEPISPTLTKVLNFLRRRAE